MCERTLQPSGALLQQRSSSSSSWQLLTSVTSVKWVKRNGKKEPAAHDPYRNLDLPVILSFFFQLKIENLKPTFAGLRFSWPKLTEVEGRETGGTEES